LVKLLISIKNPSELESAIRGGADIIDVKDPSRGSLGLPDYTILREVLGIIRRSGMSEVEVSFAGGDVRGFKPDLEYIAYTAGSLNVNYFKVGLALKSVDEARMIGLRISDILSSFNTKLVLVGYADFKRIEFIEPLEVIDIARGVEGDVVMIDTYVKDGKTTFDFLTRNYLEDFTEKARENGLMSALAGGLKKYHVHEAIRLGFNIVGFRGAVCTGGRDGVVSEELVREIKEVISLTTKSYLHY
jgi:uncharacterized protein (UPF0264 family)